MIKNKGSSTSVVIIVFSLVFVLMLLMAIGIMFFGMLLNMGAIKDKNGIQTYSLSDGTSKTISSKNFNILMTSENKELEDLIKNNKTYTHDYDINIDYADNFDAISILNQGIEYDALFLSNSIWQYKLKSNVSFKNAKSTSITPVVFGIKKSKAETLGFTNAKVYTRDIIKAIENNELKFVMSNPTTTNSGASAYFALLYTLADYPVVLTKEHLEDPIIENEIKEFFKGQERTIGNETFLEEAFLNGDYEAVVSYEYSLMKINKELESQGKEPLYLVYPYDGVAICDNVFGYIDNKDTDKLEMFLEIQDYLLSPEAKEQLSNLGRRTWYGGTTSSANKSLFNPSWGIDTTKYINAVKFPTKDVIDLALSTYQTQLRKPVHVVFCLDYSGSMRWDGYNELVDAMDFILTDAATEEYIQFSEKDIIDVILFESDVITTLTTNDGTDTEAILDDIKNREPYGGTNLYDTSVEALRLLKDEDPNERNRSIILMTDGEGNKGYYSSLQNEYNNMNQDIPIYSIMFGDANAKQLNTIATLTNGKVFNGKTDLVKAFKEVRGYN